jgi:hypothetical protein
LACKSATCDCLCSQEGRRPSVVKRSLDSIGSSLLDRRSSLDSIGSSLIGDDKRSALDEIGSSLLDKRMASSNEFPDIYPLGDRTSDDGDVERRSLDSIGSSLLDKRTYGSSIGQWEAAILRPKAVYEKRYLDSIGSGLLDKRRRHM